MNISHLSRRIVRAASSVARNMVSDPIMILNFHQVIEPTSSANLLSVSETRFGEQMAVLAKHFKVIPLDDLVTGTAFERGSKEGRQVIITFDDGYWDTYKNALPILEKYKLPAAVFVTTGAIGELAPFWWDELESLLIKRIPAGTSLMPLKPYLPRTPEEPIDDNYRRHHFYMVSTGFKLIRPEVVATCMEILRGMAPSPQPQLERESKRTVTETELAQLASSPLIHIGSHTVDHPSLGTLTREEQRFQLRESKQWLESKLNRKINTIAYPYGGETDFNNDTIEVAQELGYRCGLTTEQGTVNKGAHSYRLPRLFVHNWNGDTFLRKMNRFYWFST